MWIEQLNPSGPSMVFQVDPSTPLLGVRRTRIPFGSPGYGSVWVPDFDASIVRRYDDTTGELQLAIHAPAAPQLPLVVAAGGMWVACHHAGEIAEIDPSTTASSRS